MPSDLITIDRAAHHPQLKKLQVADSAYLSLLISAASTAIRRACMREFGPGTYIEYHSGGGYPNQLLQLDECPVTEITRVATTPVPAMSVRNTSTANQRATLSTSTTGIKLSLVSSAVQTAATLLYSDYATLTALAAAINGLGNGWFAVAASGYALWAAADLKPLQGAVTAVNASAQMEVYTEDMQCAPSDQGYANLPAQGWRLDSDSGQLWGSFPEGRLNIRVDYSAGEDAVPDDVQQGCVRLVALMYEYDKRNTAVKEYRIGPYTEKFVEQAYSLIYHPSVWDLIGPVRDCSKMI